MGALTTFRRNAALGLRKSYAGDGDWVSSSMPGNRSSIGGGLARTYWTPGTRINWDNIKGDLWKCAAAQACLNWMYRNAPQAPPVVRQKNRKGDWEPLPAHPLERLLTRPNPEYDWTILLMQMIFSDEADGNQYIAIETDGKGLPRELWWLPHHRVTPVTLPNSPNIIDYYTYTPPNRLQPRRIEVENMFHGRYGLDPYDPRLGLSPLAAADRGIFSLQASANYRANILRNFGAVGAFFSSKNDATAEWDPQALVDEYNEKVTGDNVGRALAIDAAVDLTFPQTTPQNMAIETIDDRPEADVCALFGLPPQVVNLHVGRLSKTYANVREARESAWEEKLMPTLNRYALQLQHRLMPYFLGRDVANNPAALQSAMDDIQLGFDYSNVRPLQPDLDALHTRSRDDWMANTLTLAEWCAEVGRDAPPADVANMRYLDFKGAAAPQLPPDMQPGQPGQKPPKGMALADLMPSEWAERVRSELSLIPDYEGASSGNGTH